MIKTPRELARKLRRLPAKQPMTIDFERVLERRRIWSRDGVWYSSQKEHWIGWLSEYTGPGYYGRKNSQRSARFVYNHILCPPMLLWLVEASGIPRKKVVNAKESALAARPQLAAQCAAIRKVVPWEEIEPHLYRFT